MTLPWRAHGAARLGAGLGERAGDPPELSAASREALGRADVTPEEAHLAWELARLAPGLVPEDRRALEALALLVTEALARGSTRIARADLEERAAEVLADRALGAYLARRLDEGAFADLAGDDRPLVIEGGFVTSERVRAVERALVARVDALAARPASDAALAARPASDAGSAASEALARVLARPSVSPRGPVVLTAEQRGAVELALTRRFAMISGGPGTGKTSIVVTLLRAAMARGDLTPSDIALAAPTGKAAERMRAAIEPALATIEDALPTDRALLEGLPRPRTIHRLLGWSPSARRFRHHEASPLWERLVVLDEGSMIDLFLMERVLASLGSGAQLVLLGDADQLPSVAAGAVFRDLAARAPSVRLTHSHRVDPSQPEGSHILEVAARVNRGELPDMNGPGVFLRDAAPEARQRFLRDWLERARLGEPARRTFVRDAEGWREPERLDALFTRAQMRALLCVTRHGWRPTSVEAVNAWAHRELAGEPRWVAGEPVMVTENDYEHGLFNGDRGLLLWVAPDLEATPRLCAVFRREERFAAFPLDAIRGVLELAWATTVHKAQGSEHDEVVLLMPDEDHPRLSTREVVYTAITRARRRVDIVASPALLARAIRRRVERATGLADR